MIEFCDIQLSSVCIKASITFDSRSSWRPNLKKDKIKLFSNDTNTNSIILSSALSDNQENHFSIKFDVALSEDIVYKLVYVDEDDKERGVSAPFMYSSHEDEPLLIRSLGSSGSFEAVSDDEHSFTVINAEDMSISKNWEITVHNSSTENTTDDDESDDESDDSENNCNHEPTTTTTVCPVASKKEVPQNKTTITNSHFAEPTFSGETEIEPLATCNQPPPYSTVERLENVSRKNSAMQRELSDEEEEVVRCSESMSKSFVIPG